MSKTDKITKEQEKLLTESLKQIAPHLNRAERRAWLKDRKKGR